MIIRTIEEASKYRGKLGDVIEVETTSEEMPKPVRKVKRKAIKEDLEDDTSKMES